MDLVFLSFCAAVIVYTSHKVSVQSIIKLWRGQCHIVYEFQDGAMAVNLDSRMEQLLQLRISMWPGCIQLSAQCDIWLWSRCHFYTFRMAVMAV